MFFFSYLSSSPYQRGRDVTLLATPRAPGSRPLGRGCAVAVIDRSSPVGAFSQNAPDKPLPKTDATFGRYIRPSCTSRCCYSLVRVRSTNTS